jgi:hypothetical protein
MANDPTFYADGHTPRRTDTELQVTQKILGALNDGITAASLYNPGLGTFSTVTLTGNSGNQQILIGP